MYASTKKPGNISSAFANNLETPLPQKFKDLKDTINPKDVEESWKRLIASFEAEIEIIQSRGPNVVPEIDFQEIVNSNGKIPAEKVEEIKKRGCIVIRNVVSPELALQYKRDIRTYIAKNLNHIVGYPGNDSKLNMY